jgi:chromosome segregation ATPase
MNITLSVNNLTSVGSGSGSSGTPAGGKTASLEARLRNLQKQETSVEDQISKLTKAGTSSESGQEELQLYEQELTIIETQIQQVEQQLAEAQAQAQAKKASATGSKASTSGAVLAEDNASGEKRKTLPDYSTMEVEA